MIDFRGEKLNFIQIGLGTNATFIQGGDGVSQLSWQNKAPYMCGNQCRGLFCCGDKFVGPR